LSIFAGGKEWIEEQPQGRFILICVALDFGLSIPLAALVYAVLVLTGNVPEPEILDLSLGYALGTIFIAPPAETLLFQMAPIWVTGFVTGSKPIQLGVAAALFAGLHGAAGGWAAVLGTLPGGVILAYAYLRWKRESTWSGFKAATLIHALHNAILMTLLHAITWLTL